MRLIIPVGLDEVKLLPGVKVRYLYAPGVGESGENAVQRIRYGVWRFTIYHVVLFQQNNQFCII